MASNEELNAAAAEYRKAKDAEALAVADRLSAEDKLIALVGIESEGTKTAKTDRHVIKTVRKWNYSLDQSSWPGIARDLGEVRDTLERVKFEPSVSGFKALLTANPELYAKAAEALTIKPAKPSVSVELIKSAEKAL